MAPMIDDVAPNAEVREWDIVGCEVVRAKVDAAMFQMFGIKCEGIDCIVDGFSAVKRKDEAVHGGCHTKRLILAVYGEVSGVYE